MALQSLHLCHTTTAAEPGRTAAHLDLSTDTAIMGAGPYGLLALSDSELECRSNFGPSVGSRLAY